MTEEVSPDDNLTHVEKDEVARERQLLWGVAAAVASLGHGAGVAFLEGGWEMAAFMATFPTVVFCVAKAGYYSGWRLYHWQDTIDMLKLLDRWKAMDR